MNPDQDLHGRFQALRQADRQETPLWNGDVLHLNQEAGTHHELSGRWRSWRLVWLPAGAAALLSAGLFLTLRQPRQESLSEALPVLLDAPAKPMFTSLETESSSPSDFLLPDRFTLQIP